MSQALLLAGTLALLAAPLPNFLKLISLLGLWLFAFRPISRKEAVAFLAISALFTGLNVGALAQGVFRFAQPDLAGLPAWELGMWGFYLLHAIRVVRGPVPEGNLPVALATAAAFALPFSTIADPQLLFWTTAAVLAAAFLFFHERHDFLYAGYMLLVGTLVEYTGVWSGQWSYPGDTPPGGVPPWFATMWAGVGLFTRRLVLPWLGPARGRSAEVVSAPGR